MVQPIAVALGRLHLRPRVRQRLLRLLHRAPRALDRSQIGARKIVEQRAVAARVEQAAIVMLAVDLDQK
jgi:hypothetical protein